MVEAVTYRYRGHSKSDRQAYRTRDEVKEWQAHDPIPRFAKAAGLSDAELAALRAEAGRQIEAAVAYAEASPEPEPGQLLEGVYA